MNFSLIERMRIMCISNLRLAWAKPFEVFRRLSLALALKRLVIGVLMSNRKSPFRYWIGNLFHLPLFSAPQVGTAKRCPVSCVHNKTKNRSATFPMQNNLITYTMELYFAKRCRTIPTSLVLPRTGSIFYLCFQSVAKYTICRRRSISSNVNLHNIT